MKKPPQNWFRVNQFKKGKVCLRAVYLMLISTELQTAVAYSSKGHPLYTPACSSVSPRVQTNSVHKWAGSGTVNAGMLALARITLSRHVPRRTTIMERKNSETGWGCGERHKVSHVAPSCGQSENCSSHGLKERLGHAGDTREGGAWKLNNPMVECA